MKFQGTMVSANIFPDFTETARLRDDLSLGFVHHTPAEGYPTYQAKGNYKGDIDLSNKGFYGKGTVGYLTASIKSEDIVFDTLGIFPKTDIKRTGGIFNTFPSI